MGMGASVNRLLRACQREASAKQRFTLARRGAARLHGEVHGQRPRFGATLVLSRYDSDVLTRRIAELPLPYHLRRAGTWDLALLPDNDRALCPVRSLATLLRAAATEGCQGFAGEYVFRGYCWRYPEVISSAALADRLSRALSMHAVVPSGDVRGYTLHSFHRGRLQHEHAGGATYDRLMQLSGITTMSVLQRYLDRGRHM